MQNELYFSFFFHSSRINVAARFFRFSFLSPATLLLALNLTLLLYRWQCQLPAPFLVKDSVARRPLQLQTVRNFLPIGRATSLMTMSKS